MRIFGIIYMHLKNRFKNEDKMRVWIDHPYSALSGSNKNCSLHHVYGCEKDDTDSIYNAIMLDYEEHKSADNHNQFEMGDERRIKYISLAIKQIMRSGYVNQPRDIRFLEKIKPDFDKAVALLGDNVI